MEVCHMQLENILLKTSDDDAPIKIADFGLSKLFGASTVLSTICGSPQYVGKTSMLSAAFPIQCRNL